MSSGVRQGDHQGLIEIQGQVQGGATLYLRVGERVTR